MKSNIIFILFYILVSLFVLRVLYYVYIYYNKEVIINKILYEWNNKTNGGFIKKAKNNYADDYYLSFSKYEDNQNHIHLITNRYYYDYDSFINVFFTSSFELMPTITIGYVLKKDNKNSLPIKINDKDTPKNICKKMIEHYHNFEST